MNLHEHQAKELLARFGVPVLPGHVAFTVEEALKGAQELPGNLWVVKAQIHAGGRGKAGGVKLARSLEEVEVYAKEILAKTLITPQTGPKGKRVERLYVEAGSAIEKELYLSMLIDRSTGRLSIVASTEGGTEIEEVAHHSPEKICTLSIDPAIGFMPFHKRRLIKALNLTDKHAKAFAKLVEQLHEAFWKTDASLLEINPLALTPTGEVVPLDAKMSIDDNALARHPDIAAMRDLSEEEPAEVAASAVGLNYVKMDGNIGCMVNGAGLAMATMDIIQLHGGTPANFLDVGGGATKEQVTQAFQIILQDANVRGILVNIFGGIMRCDIIAEGIIAAAKEMALTIPVVVRLAGTRVEEGKELLRHSGLNLIPADDLAEAAEKIVSAVKEEEA